MLEAGAPAKFPFCMDRIQDTDCVNSW